MRRRSPSRRGNVGAGVGAIGRPFFGRKGGTKGGLGSSAARQAMARWAIVITNCVGNVVDSFRERHDAVLCASDDRVSSRWMMSFPST